MSRRTEPPASGPPLTGMPPTASESVRIAEARAASRPTDDRWEWIEVGNLSKAEPDWVRGRCKHTEIVPVESGGVVVARLCLTCDTQLEA
jgi:hypothetical protein